MSRFDVYAPRGKAGPGYVLDVQANRLRELATRVVVPLVPAERAHKPAPGLNPDFDIDGHPHRMLTQYISAIPAKGLGRPVLSLEMQSDDIMRALDMLLIGF